MWPSAANCAAVFRTCRNNSAFLEMVERRSRFPRWIHPELNPVLGQSQIGTHTLNTSLKRIDARLFVSSLKISMNDGAIGVGCRKAGSDTAEDLANIPDLHFFFWFFCNNSVVLRKLPEIDKLSQAPACSCMY